MDPHAAITLPFGLSVVDGATLFAGIAAVASMAAVWAATTVRDPMQGRIRALQAQRELLKSGLVTSRRRTSEIKQSDALDFLRGFLSKLKVLQNDNSKQIQDKLARAGFRTKDAVVAYQSARLIGPFLFGAVAVLLIYGNIVMAGSGLFQKMGASLGAVVLA